MKNYKFNGSYFLIAIIGINIIQSLMIGFSNVSTIPYSEFRQLLKKNQVADIVLIGNEIKGQLLEPGPKQKKFFVTKSVDLDMAKELDLYSVKYTQVIKSTFMRDILSWLLPTIFFLLVWFFLIKKMADKGGGISGGFMSIGKSKAKVYA